VIATLISTVPSGNNCAWSVTYTYTIKDGCNNAAANAVVTYTGGDTQAPTLTGVLPGGAVGSVCKANAPAAPTVATIASKYTDNCSGVVVVQIGSSVTGTNCSWTATYTYSVKDACNNAAANAVVVYTGGDVTPPTFTRPADITILFISPGVYDASPAVTGDVTNEADNCGVGQATYTDAVAVQCGNNLIITRTWHLVDNCSNAAANQVQTITVTDNNSPYVIYAQKEAKFGEDNIINGDVGVTDANGKAEFKKNDVLDPYHVYAKNITVQMPATVNNKHFVPATGGPNPPFQLYVANPLSGNYTQSVNGVVPAGNYKNLTIKKNVVATVNGSNYGKITIEEGAIVTFTSSNMNIEELSVGKGKKGIALTTVIFTNSAAVKIKDRVTIEEDCRINIGGPKVTFYLGDSKKDEENFMVKGDDTQITLNIMIPNGKLKIEKKSDDCIMTGWFIIEKLESTGSTTWNGYGCVPPLAMPVTSRGGVSEAKEVKQTPVVAKQEAFAVTVSPNPSASVFSIRIAGSSDEPVMIRVLDLSGKVMEIKTGMSKGSTVTVGARLIGGSYFAEVTQGSNRKVVKLLKLN
jgi:molybdopterin-binding protein